jgi:acetylornithine deacetylase/succinyl-diaminopimelate desuccinylase-like protein
MMTVILLKRMGVPLDRDVIFVAEAGEEGTSDVGINYLVREHWYAIDAEFALAEGGAGVSRDGQVRYVSVATTEKVPRGAKLIAHGTAGHGSRPRPDNAVIRLADAVAKVGAWEPPMRLNDTTRAYFERLATVSSPADADRYLHVVDEARSREIQTWFLNNEPGNYSILRTSVVPTVMNIGFRTNVIPSQGEAVLDIRALPDEDMNKFYDELRTVIGDRNVDVVPNPFGSRPATPPSRMDSDMFGALERVTKRMYGAAPVIPMMMTGATDMAQLRGKGVQAYGIGPVADEKDGGLGAAHTDDERLLEQSLYDFVRFQFEAVMEVAASKR